MDRMYESNKVLIEVKDGNLKTYKEIERVIQQKTSGGIMRVNYNKKSYIVRGGFRNNLFIRVAGE